MNIALVKANMFHDIQLTVIRPFFIFSLIIHMAGHVPLPLGSFALTSTVPY
jgi:hypothetical protein